MRGQIDLDTECLVDLLCDSRASKPGVALLHCNDGLDEFVRWSLGTRFRFATSRIRQSILSLLEQVVKSQKRRRPDNYGSPTKAVFVEKQRPQPEQKPIQCREIGRTSPGTIDNEELLLHQQAVGDDGPGTTGPQKFGDRGQ